MTNYGITHGVYDQYRRSKKLPVRSVKLITSDEVKEIYKNDYYDKICGDDLPLPLAYVLFDSAVNQYWTTARKYLIKEIGGKTYRQSIDKMYNTMTYGQVCLTVVFDILDMRRAKYKSLANSDPYYYGGFLKGWLNRMNKIEHQVLGLM